MKRYDPGGVSAMQKNAQTNINVYQIEKGSYVIRTGNQVTIIKFTK
jgi:hypothetical protein